MFPRTTFPRTRIAVGACVVLTLLGCGASSARQNALETTALLDIRSLHTAQVQYSAQFGRYATNISELRAADLIPATLASGEKDGYKFTMTATPAGYAINASPKVYGETGRRTFYSDQTMAIHQNRTNEPATSSSPELK